MSERHLKSNRLSRLDLRPTFAAALLAVSFLLSACAAKDSPLEPPLGQGGAGGQGGSQDASVDKAAEPPPPAPDDWCSARQVLTDNCVSCHYPGTIFQTIPLVTFDDLQIKLPSGQVTFASVKDRIHDMMRLMPPTADRLTPVELATLDNWINAGAKSGGNPSCTPGGGNDGGADGGTVDGGGTTDSGTVDSGRPDGAVDAGDAPPIDGGDAGRPDSSDGGDGGTQPPTDWPTDCEDRYTVLAHGVSSPTDKTKFNVSASTTTTSKDFYECFSFKLPWGATTVQGLRFRPVIDDARVVARWALYSVNSSSGADGQVTAGGCSGTLLQSWGPGANEITLPKDVGLQMPRGTTTSLALEVHYDNTANYRDSMDASGVEYCVTKTLRTNTASVHWLGSTSFSVPVRAAGVDVTNTCDPSSTQAVHLVAIQPQLNRLGVRSKLVVNRSSGSTETLHDDPFALTDQRVFPSQAVINNGDTLTTTCSYKNTSTATVNYGNAMTDENCFQLVTAYPAGALSSLLTANQCIGIF